MFCRLNSFFRAGLAILLFATIYNIYGNVSEVLALSLSTNGAINLDVSASGNGANVVADNVTINSACPLGYTLSIKGPADATLYKDGDKTNSSKILASVGTKDNPVSILSNKNTWGYTTGSNISINSNFTGLNNTITELTAKNSGSASGGDVFSVYYGVSVDETLGVGTYKLAESSAGANDNVITYYLTANPDCDNLYIRYHDNGANSVTKMGSQQVSVSAGSLTLWASNFKREEYGFAGWNTKADGTGTSYGPNQTINSTTPETLETFIENNAIAEDGVQYVDLYANWIKADEYLQNWRGCSAMEIGDVTALTDYRDEDTYAVAKLADGECWMIENLRLGETNSTEVSVYETDSKADFTLAASTDPSVTAWCQRFNTACNDQSMFYAGNTEDPVANMTDPNANIYSYGNYYNWYSATVGTGTYATDSGDAESSICPKGWHLPYGGSDARSGGFSYLDIKLGGTGDTRDGAGVSNRWFSYPNNLVYAGTLSTSMIYDRGKGVHYTAATASNAANARILYAEAARIIPGVSHNLKSSGQVVRCVVNSWESPWMGNIMYDDNGANSLTKMNQQEEGASATSATLRASNFKRSGYGFAGWNTKADGTGTSYGPNETITLPADFAPNGLKLYAMWVESEGDLQGWDGCSAMSIGDITALTDTRDNDTYAIAKLADGKCWMIENLRLDNTATITAANTNNPVSGFALSDSVDPTQTAWCATVNADCVNQTMLFSDSTTDPVASMSWINQKAYGYGNYYNLYAATTGNGNFSVTDSDVSGDICPLGWRLPTGTVSGEFYALNNLINDGSTSTNTGLRTYPNNFVQAGVINMSSMSDRGTGGYYWSSTVSDAGKAHSLTFSPMQNDAGASRHIYRFNGRSVRCVAASN